MACAKCGKAKKNMSEPPVDIVTLEYTGTNEGVVKKASNFRRGHYYTFSAKEREFDVYAEDVNDFIALGGFRLAPVEGVHPKLRPKSVKANQVSTLEAVGFDRVTIEQLAKLGITTVEQIKALEDEVLGKFEGAALVRLKAVRSAPY